MALDGRPKVHVGVVGAGIGGLAAAIAIRKAGAEVTVLEAAEQLGEIGAGIQMTPNVSILLQRWGVDKVIGDNLVQFEELNMRRKCGTKVGHVKIATLESSLGHPWWVVHRAHLHEGLLEIATRSGAEVHVDSFVTNIDHESAEKVTVETRYRKRYSFDLLLGADGVNSITRKTLFPRVKPEPPTTNCAYRALVPYEEIRKDPVAKKLIEKLTMEVWMGENAYIITYPISGGKLFNLVLSHHTKEKLHATQPDIPIEEFRDQYKDFDPRIKRIIDMVGETSRWPLMVTGPMTSWSSPRKNVVLMGDAAHSMVNHMAQGAATAMEDGAFLGRCIEAVVQGRIDIPEAIGLYETERMPKAHVKQQLSFLNGCIWHLPDGPEQEARDRAMEPDSCCIRSSNLYADPQTVLEVYGYDAEYHAETSIENYLHGGTEASHPETGVTPSLKRKYMDWFLPRNASGIVEPPMMASSEKQEQKRMKSHGRDVSEKAQKRKRAVVEDDTDEDDLDEDDLDEDGTDEDDTNEGDTDEDSDGEDPDGEDPGEEDPGEEDPGEEDPSEEDSEKDGKHQNDLDEDDSDDSAEDALDEGRQTESCESDASEKVKKSERAVSEDDQDVEDSPRPSEEERREGGVRKRLTRLWGALKKLGIKSRAV